MARGANKFVPRMVPEVRSGYYWLAKDAVGIGTTSFRVPEGNKHSTFDLVQATVTSQPTVLNENEGTQFRMRKAADTNPAFLATSGNVKAGWTGATYMAGWFRLPDANGDVTGTGGLIIHYGGAGTRRIRIITVAGTPDELSCGISIDGTSTTTNRFVITPLVGSNWVWLEEVFQPVPILGGSTNTDRLRLLANFNLLALGSSSQAQPDSIADSSTPVVVASLNSTTANADTTDWVTCYYCNGIPILKNRKRLANYLNPSNIKFSIV